MRAHERTIFSLMLALLVTLLASTSSAQYAGDIKTQPYVYKDIFPLFGKKLAARGVRFPKPWGAGLTYAFIQQPVEIDRIALGVNHGELVDASNFIKFGSVDSKVQALNARLDLWLFPFLSVYVMGNYAPSASTDVELSEPFALSTGADQWLAGEGFGLTAAFGARGVWATMDVNFTWNHAELLADPVSTILMAPRVGTQVGRWGKVKLNLWLGAMGQIIGADTSGSIKLSDALGTPEDGLKDKVNDWYDGLSGLQQRLVQPLVDRVNDSNLDEATVQYELDKRVAYRWNMLVGTQIEISES